MNKIKYTLVGLVPSVLGCAGPLSLTRDDRILYTVTCNYQEENDLHLTKAYNLDLSVRHVCLENKMGESFKLTFRKDRVSGKIRKLTNELSDLAEGQEILISTKDILDAQNDLGDGCVVATTGFSRNVKTH